VINTNCVIYGPEYVGKRNFVTNLGKDKNHNYYFSTKQVREKMWEAFKKWVKGLPRDEPGSLFVIDKINKLYESCVDFICDEEGEEHPTMAGTKNAMLWRLIKTEMEEQLYKFSELPGQKFYIADVAVKHIDLAIYKGSQVTPDYPWVLEQIMPDIIDQTLFMTPKYVTNPEGKRKVVTRIMCSPRPDIYAGDNTGKLSSQIKNYKQYEKEMKDGEEQTNGQSKEDVSKDSKGTGTKEKRKSSTTSSR